MDYVNEYEGFKKTAFMNTPIVKCVAYKKESVTITFLHIKEGNRYLIGLTFDTKENSKEFDERHYVENETEAWEFMKNWMIKNKLKVLIN